MADGDDGEKMATAAENRLWFEGGPSREETAAGQAWGSDIQEIDDPFEAASYDSLHARRPLQPQSDHRHATDAPNMMCAGARWSSVYRDLVDLLASIELFGRRH